MKALGRIQVIASLNRAEPDAAVPGIGMHFHLCISIHDAAFMGPSVTLLLTEETVTHVLLALREAGIAKMV